MKLSNAHTKSEFSPKIGITLNISCRTALISTNNHIPDPGTREKCKPELPNCLDLHLPAYDPYEQSTPQSESMSQPPIVDPAHICAAIGGMKGADPDGSKVRRGGDSNYFRGNPSNPWWTIPCSNLICNCSTSRSAESACSYVANTSPSTDLHRTEESTIQKHAYAHY
jgi:hypothetical protein